MNSAAAPPAIDDGEIIFEIPDSFRIYRSGRVERLFEDVLVAPSLDPATLVQSKDVVINPSTGLSVRIYLPPAASSTNSKLPILVSIHGGGFCLLRSSSSIYQSFINPLTAKARVLTVSIDYRLAPEHPLPAAYDDCWEALSWVVGRGGADDPWLSKFGDLDTVFLSGESAGANIAHNLAMRLGREGLRVEGLMLLHPFFWGERRIGNEGEEAKERKVQEAAVLWKTVCPATTGLDDPLINPVADGAPSLADLGCRRVLVCVAELDLLRDRGRIYYEKLKESGWAGVAEFLESEGVDHGFFFRDGGVTTEELRERMISFMNNFSIPISNEV
ncbi:putative carboxylesterase 2 [Platanthera guangdongensis]|uniref:Carboxylesterase 2 n=1 Tax=Platanthera guangdongensis TaxID=2320717 RepID=A0ABR2N403_9ASPA